MLYESIPTIKIISGGQTGIDQLGLEVAKSIGYETGGTAPPGFRTELGNDLNLSKRYGLIEVTKEQQSWSNSQKTFYLPRTEQNVLNSDATVYFATKDDSAGLRATKSYATKHKKPFILNPDGQELYKWLCDNEVKVLNVAGNRGSKCSPKFIDEVRHILEYALVKSS